ncbi:uncharacterized protein CLUP02_17825 [Colletotrichum lupini]|uniref:Heterokaryon incompatibility domain-containing protein n=1 Tax=Colletotrichum lupini TaxID=145971 RepID=A0A9Q8WB45_9PEZI|nr:uncharacterized protein CLUP02_17825 [Colletotrichum lupini]UQC76312.1 hypothetical protein CLUP02_17825 [Colletotrichum lupini]
MARQGFASTPECRLKPHAVTVTDNQSTCPPWDMEGADNVKYDRRPLSPDRTLSSTNSVNPSEGSWIIILAPNGDRGVISASDLPSLLLGSDPLKDGGLDATISVCSRTRFNALVLANLEANSSIVKSVNYLYSLSARANQLCHYSPYRLSWANQKVLNFSILGAVISLPAGLTEFGGNRLTKRTNHYPIQTIRFLTTWYARCIPSTHSTQYSLMISIQEAMSSVENRQMFASNSILLLTDYKLKSYHLPTQIATILIINEDYVSHKKSMQSLTVALTKKGVAMIAKTYEIAKQSGIYWAWVDTCCTDKSNSAELTDSLPGCASIKKSNFATRTSPILIAAGSLGDGTLQEPLSLCADRDQYSIHNEAEKLGGVSEQRYEGICANSSSDFGGCADFRSLSGSMNDSDDIDMTNKRVNWSLMAEHLSLLNVDKGGPRTWSICDVKSVALIGEIVFFISKLSEEKVPLQSEREGLSLKNSRIRRIASKDSTLSITFHSCTKYDSHKIVHSSSSILHFLPYCTNLGYDCIPTSQWDFESLATEEYFPAISTSLSDAMASLSESRLPKDEKVALSDSRTKSSPDPDRMIDHEVTIPVTPAVASSESLRHMEY